MHKWIVLINRKYELIKDLNSAISEVVISIISDGMQFLFKI